MANPNDPQSRSPRDDNPSPSLDMPVAPSTAGDGDGGDDDDVLEVTPQTTYAQCLMFPSPQPNRWSADAVDDSGSRVSEVKPAVAAMLRALMNSAPQGRAMGVRMRFDLPLSDICAGYKALLERLGDLPIGIEAAHLLGEEAEWEARFMASYQGLLSELWRAAELPGLILLRNQEVHRYVGYDGSHHRAKTDISAALLPKAPANPAEGNPPTTAPTASTTSTQSLGIHVEGKTALALTDSDMRALDELHLREATIALHRTPNREKFEVVHVPYPDDHPDGQMQPVSTQVANTVYKLLEAPAYAWIRKEKFGALTNGPRWAVTRNGDKAADDTSNDIHVSQALGVTGTGERVPARIALEDQENEEAEDVGYDAIFGRYDRTASTPAGCLRIEPGTEDLAKRGSYPEDLFSLFASYAVQALSPNNAQQSSHWPSPDKAAPRTPEGFRLYKTRRREAAREAEEHPPSPSTPSPSTPSPVPDPVQPASATPAPAAALNPAEQAGKRAEIFTEAIDSAKQAIAAAAYMHVAAKQQQRSKLEDMRKEYVSATSAPGRKSAFEKIVGQVENLTSDRQRCAQLRSRFEEVNPS